jgi:DNA modification methylase
MPSGSLILHLDYHAVHDMKVRLDRLFGREGFINEIIWHYTGGGRSKRRFSCKHDTLLWYSNGADPLFNIDAVRIPYKKTSGYAKGGIVSAAGRTYLPNPLGTPLDDVWDIPIINPLSHERTGYPTQKPLVLLERIISALTAKEDLVGDPFCGSGTTLFAALRLGRRARGADVSKAAIDLSQARLTTILS